MAGGLRGLIRKQFINYAIFRAYSLRTLLKEAVLLPRDLLSGSGRSSNLLNIALFVTTRCNARCAMCNVSDILNDGSMPDIPLAKIESLLDDVARYRPGIVLFGGEPSTRRDILEIVAAVKRRGLSAGMFTNGLSLGRELADRLMGEKLDYIAFSLQGTKEVHDKILSVPGAYDRMMSTIRYMASKKPRHTRVITHTTICEFNLNDLSKVADTALGLGADLVRFGHPTFYSEDECRAASSALKAAFPGAAEIAATSYVYDVKGREELYYKKINDLKKEFGGRIAFTPELSYRELKSWYSPKFGIDRSCLFAWRSLFIRPNGDAYPCESISYNMGNVFTDGFDNVWNGPKYTEFRRKLRQGLFPACSRCCKL